MKAIIRLFLGVLMCMAGLSMTAHAKDVVKAEFRACPTGTAIGDVPSCGKIWKLKSGKGSVGADGSLKISLKGLVLDDVSVGEYNGTPDGVGHVVGAVLCSGMVAAQTEWVVLAKNGDVNIKAKLDLPANCIAPTLVVREVWEGNVGGWLAAVGY